MRVTKEVFRDARGLVRAGKFASDYQVFQVALEQAASTKRILTPGTLAQLPPSRGRKSEFARTYLSKEQHVFVRRQLKDHMGSDLDQWIRLVARGVPAPGTAAFMANHVHRGRAPHVEQGSCP